MWGLGPSDLVCLLVLAALALVVDGHVSDYHHLEKDSRLIHFQDLMSSSKRFYDQEVASYSELLFDVNRNQMIVGARDNIFRMSFDLDLLERSVWEAEPEKITLCQAKGQSVELCRNFIRVLQTYGENQLYACGTFAFDPKCSRRQMENLTAIDFESGVGKCPFNPLSNITSYMTESGQIFVGSATDFMGSDAAFLRTDVDPQMPNYQKIIRTKQYNSHWLNNPHFVGSFEAGNFIYFLFREVAVEYINCGKAIYSRIARVCKNDVSGDHILRDNWTSFLKARLYCSLPGEYPFYFNEIQGMTYSSEEGILYATFTTPDNSIYGSAVCAFNISSINEAFAGPFKYQDHIGAEWKSINSPHRHQFSCEAAPTDLRHKRLLESSRYQLMENAVQPITEQPLYHAKLERFKFIAIDVVQTKYEKVQILYVSTNKNYIKKLSVKLDPRNPKKAQTCLVEIWQSDDTNMSKILSMSYLKHTDSLYLGTDLALTKIPGQHCSRHATQESCLNAMDPYCGWNERIEKCTPQELGMHVYKYWLQPKVLKCPLLTAPIDGGWSSWSEWEKCKKHGEEDGDCMCRSRKCNNPAPQNGGSQCQGITTEVQNCTVHGGWTEWSPWSVCSGTCGKGIKTKYRTCSNPKPAYGGRTCVGPDRSEIYCSQLPPCPAPTKPAVDGGWGPWGDWSECSAACGGGIRIRRRECDDPVPQNGGQECPGCNIDYEDCNMQTCPEVKKLSAWTPWLVQSSEVQEPKEGQASPNKQRVERRFRYACRATTPDASSVRINLVKEETRTCYPDGSCQRFSDHNEAEPEMGAEWSACNVTCGGGVQYRLHEGKHRGRHAQSRPCNTQPCNALQNLVNEVQPSPGWSCWTEWTPCSVSCGVGLRRRTRKCLASTEEQCEGKSVEEEGCEMPPCTDFLGWGEWSQWSACSEEGMRMRHRKCKAESPTDLECRGSQYEKTACVPNECEGGQVLTAGTISLYVAVNLVFAALCCFLTFLVTKRRYETPAATIKNNTAAPYDTYPNQYSSLPTKDFYEVRPKVKRQSSFNMCSPSKNTNTGTLNRNNIHHNHTPKVLSTKTYIDYETTTLKRNSNAMNNYRNNIDDEKF